LQKNWIDRNVDLKLLVTEIGKFFTDNDFDVTANETESGYQLLARGSPNYEINGQVSVTVDGKPEEFSITIELQSESKVFSYPIILTTIFGGGFLFRQFFRSDEEWMKLKRDFWQQIDGIVAWLSGSADTSARRS